MKKLMIAALIGLTGIAVNAATIDWQYGTYMCSEAETPLTENYQVYFFDGNGAISSSEMIKALGTDGSLEALNSNIFNGYINASDDAWIMMENNNLSVVDNGSKNGNVSGYAVIVDSVKGSTADPTKFYVVDFGSHDVTDAEFGASKIYFGEEQTIVGDPSGWSKIAAVPEPTSGLLLLLGVAGLALRRRRA